MIFKMSPEIPLLLKFIVCERFQGSVQSGHKTKFAELDCMVFGGSTETGC